MSHKLDGPCGWQTLNVDPHSLLQTLDSMTLPSGRCVVCMTEFWNLLTVGLLKVRTKFILKSLKSC